MKAILKLSTFFVIMFASISLSLAQNKEDVIYLADGTQKKGKVISITDDGIKFSYTGEDVQYELKKQTLSKIVFANGREEVFENTASTSRVSTSTGNLLAVIPFEVVSNESGLTTDAMRREIQQSCIDALKSRGMSFQIQDARTTNAALSKSGIAFADIANHTPDDLARLLNVDYVVLGVYDIQNKGSMSYGSGVVTYNDKKQDNKSKGTAVQSNNSYTSTNYDTKVQLSIYDSNGRQLFSDTRRPFMGGLDSYKGALKTLAKRISLK
ncbi:hypothetical protein [Sphingobacterium sp. 2149]|uniref:hypothetical protein n=1 Tax=Sphingobacterium sp. 2149 TaxID=2817763 RepID=UPI002867AA65|nr:hypothetical protein [Sphingobacterium sp. 2149]MDR6734489.1 hypothetical protein [Sphingobacterium sp. 2149]